MAVITYTAKRNVAPGRQVGQEYSFAVCLSDWTPRRSPETNETTSLSGRRFTTLHRIERTWSAGIVPIHVLGPDASLARQIEEWADSVAAGETFTIDPFGTLADPLDPVEVSLEGDVRQSLASIVGYYSYSFTVRQTS